MNFGEFNVWVAVTMFIAEYAFWFLQANWAGWVNGNKAAIASLFAVAVTLSDYPSKSLAHLSFIYAIPAALGTYFGNYSGMWFYNYQKRKKNKSDGKLVLISNLAAKR